MDDKIENLDEETSELEHLRKLVKEKQMKEQEAEKENASKIVSNEEKKTKIVYFTNKNEMSLKVHFVYFFIVYFTYLL